MVRPSNVAQKTAKGRLSQSGAELVVVLILQAGVLAIEPFVIHDMANQRELRLVW